MFENLASFDFILDIGEKIIGIGLNPRKENPSQVPKQPSTSEMKSMNNVFGDDWIL